MDGSFCGRQSKRGVRLYLECLHNRARNLSAGGMPLRTWWGVRTAEVSADSRQRYHAKSAIHKATRLAAPPKYAIRRDSKKNPAPTGQASSAM